MSQSGASECGPVDQFELRLEIGRASDGQLGVSIKRQQQIIKLTSIIMSKLKNTLFMISNIIKRQDVIMILLLKKNVIKFVPYANLRIVLEILVNN